ncbi:MAG TPA: glycosyltransferase family 87 protein [Bacteroidia bacterium]|nr:glycosyltransferase family 87 protein [Bacteroidia bacterium]
MKKTFAEKFPWMFTSSFPWIFFSIIALIASVHRIILGEGSFNNYLIFERSFDHLISNVNLYVAYPEEHYDLYKYSPTFALFMAPFSLLPTWLGVTLWNLLNMILPVWAVSKLKIPQKQKTFILLIVFIELLSSVQNAQSNGIMLGLIIGAFACFENQKPVMALMLICFGFYIKLFAAAAALLLLFYPQKIKSILAGTFFVVLFAVLPLVVISWESLSTQYENWLLLLGNDPAHGLNFSFMTLLERTVGIHAGDIYFLAPGAVLLMLPLLRVKQYASFNFRFLYLCSVLIWVVIFNHKAESPTYCIAMGGIAIWYVMGEKNALRNTIMILAYLLVALSPTDIFPPYVRIHFLQPYALKALMPVVIWFIITKDLLFRKYLPAVAEDESQKTQTA